LTEATIFQSIAGDGNMEHMRRIAYETVLRACGFASLAIFCVMIGLSFNPPLAFKAGGLLTTLMAFVLIVKSREALTKDYRKTEMWLYIDKQFRPPEAYAQWASATILRDTYLTFAMWTALISVAMWALALFFSLIGVGSIYQMDQASAATTHSFISQKARLSEDHVARRPAPSIRYQIYP
jgi:hypothetical protein